MPELSLDPFRNLLSHIHPYSPRAAQILETMRKDCDQQAAYYAAFILICLQATTEISLNKAMSEYTANDFRDFAFFTVANDCALALFDELLEAYIGEAVRAKGQARKPADPDDPFTTQDRLETPSGSQVLTNRVYNDDQSSSLPAQVN